MAVWSGIHACVCIILIMHVCVPVLCASNWGGTITRGRSLCGHEYQCSRKRLLYILTNPWILLSKCCLFASNKLSESLFSPPVCILGESDSALSAWTLTGCHSLTPVWTSTIPPPPPPCSSGQLYTPWPGSAVHWIVQFWLLPLAQTPPLMLQVSLVSAWVHVYLCCACACVPVLYILVWALKYIHCMCTFAYKFLGFSSGIVK